MSEDLLALAVALRTNGEAFALATVVRCERPTSAKPGAKALIRRDGSIVGWVGGACAEPVVVREAQQAMRDGQPRLVALVGDGGATPGRTEGLVPYTMACHSGGTLEIYVEPFLPKPLLVLVGHGPVVETLAALGRATDFAVTVLAFEDVGEEEIGRLPLGPHASVVVATHGNADEDALERVLEAGAGYVSLIASRKRAASVIENLRRRKVAEDRISRVKAPAGLDIGALTPEEIAVSILAEIVQFRRAAKPAAEEDVHRISAAVGASKDPVCGMLVEIATARHRALAWGRVVYFCCAGCKDTFERDPDHYAAAAAPS